MLEPCQEKTACLKPAENNHTLQEVQVKMVPGCIANTESVSCLSLAQAPHHSAKTSLTQHSKSAATSTWIPTPAGVGEFVSLTFIAYSPASTSRNAAFLPQQPRATGPNPFLWHGRLVLRRRLFASGLLFTRSHQNMQGRSHQYPWLAPRAAPKC